MLKRQLRPVQTRLDGILCTHGMKVSRGPAAQPVGVWESDVPAPTDKGAIHIVRQLRIAQRLSAKLVGVLHGNNRYVLLLQCTSTGKPHFWPVQQSPGSTSILIYMSTTNVQERGRGYLWISVAASTKLPYPVPMTGHAVTYS
jgi:hypothetical protein